MVNVQISDFFETDLHRKCWNIVKENRPPKKAGQPTAACFPGFPGDQISQKAFLKIKYHKKKVKYYKRLSWRSNISQKAFLDTKYHKKSFPKDQISQKAFLKIKYHKKQSWTPNITKSIPKDQISQKAPFFSPKLKVNEGEDGKLLSSCQNKGKKLNL